jgi:iron complex outermembrane receptor protein
VEEVIVTAQRREERLLDVPISISVASQEEIAASGAGTTRDLSQLTPGLTSTTNGLAFQPAIRGITTTGTSAGDESNVALYLDGVYLASQAGNVFNLKNIERIEVLKGPQGTLFGRNATGGAIRIITTDPSFAPEFRASASYGTELKSKEFNVYGAMGVTDTVAVSLAANTYDDEGYVDSINPLWTGDKFGTTSSWYTRAKLLWTPNDDLRVVLSGDVGRYQSDTQFVLAPYNRLSSSKNNPAAILPTGPWQTSGSLQPNNTVRTSGGALTIEYRLPHYTLTSISGYRTARLYGMLDVDRINLLTSTATTSSAFRTFSQELNVASNYEGPINFIGGLYYFRSQSGIDRSEAFSPGPTVVNGEVVGLGVLASSNQGYVDTESTAAFGEATWQVTDQIKLIGGLRYTTESKELLTRPILPRRPDLTDKANWDNWSYRLTAQYNFNEATNVYATYSTGFKTGQYQATSPTFVQRVDPETVEAFEVGVKARIAGMVDFAASAFHYKYDDIQLQSNNFINGANNIILANAAKATITGADADLTARLGHGFRVQAGVAWMPTAEYDTFANGLDSVPRGFPGSLDPSLCPSSPLCGAGNDQIIRDLSGTRMIRAPEWTGRLAVMYEREIAGGEFTATANYFHSTKFFWVTGGHIDQPAYSVVNASAGWTTPNDRATFSIWGRNLGDEAYAIYNSPNAAGVSIAWAAPREIGFTVDVKY